MILNRFAIGIISKRPEAVQVDFITKACGHGVHQESGGRPFDLDMIGQPVPAESQSFLICYTLMLPICPSKGGTLLKQ